MNRLVWSLTISACWLLSAFAAPTRAQEEPLGAARQKITTASAVRARTGPQLAAQEITRLKLGTVVAALARTKSQEEIGGKREYWYHVGLPAGGEGWVFGGLLADYDPARRGEIFHRIVAERLRAETMSFDDGVDLYNFVAAALAAAESADERAELERQRLHALGRSLAAVPYEEREREPYRDWYRAHERESFYHELGGGFYVRSEIFWTLERKYHGTPAGERIAWDAAENPMGGECESDEVCQFLALSETQGRYLSLYPNGEHASEVLKNFETALASEELKSTLNGKGGDRYVVESRAALKKAIAELRAAAARSSAPERATVVRMLERLGQPGR